jgi:hypothetical protein
MLANLGDDDTHNIAHQDFMNTPHQDSTQPHSYKTSPLHQVLTILYKVYLCCRHLNRGTIQAIACTHVYLSTLQEPLPHQITVTLTLSDYRHCCQELDATPMLRHLLIFLLTPIEIQALVSS